MWLSKHFSLLSIVLFLVWLYAIVFGSNLFLFVLIVLYTLIFMKQYIKMEYLWAYIIVWFYLFFIFWIWFSVAILGIITFIVSLKNYFGE